MKQHFILALILSVCCVFTAWSQNVPQGFNYQSVVRNSDGTAYTDQTVTLLFSIRSGAANGPIAYSERHVTNTNEFGLVNLIVGQGEPLEGTFQAINWGGGPKYLTTLVETAPNIFSELGSTQLMSVPYALYAQNGGGSSGGNDNWGTQSAQTDATLKGNGTGGNPLGLAQQNAQTGQVLKWDGTKWIPQDDISNTSTTGGTVTQINTGAGLTGGPITTTGTVGLSNTGVTPGPYGSATQIPVITVDAQGRITSVFTVVPSPGTIAINGGAGVAVQQNGYNFTITNTGDVNPADDLTNTTQAGGDISGTFPNLQIKANAVGAAEIEDGSVGNAEIQDGSVGTSKLQDGSVTAAKIANSAVGTAQIANNAITAAKLSNMGATNGQILKWNGIAWAPAADGGGSSTNIAGGAGIAVSGTAPNLTITNTGDTNAADDITTGSQAGGDLTGPFSNLQIAANTIGTNEIAPGAVATADIADQAITGAKIDDMNATSGQVLKWNGSTWAPAADAGGTGGSTTITAGSGIFVTLNGSNYTISNLGDPDGSDDLLNTEQAGGDLSGFFTNMQIKPGAVGNGELAANAVTSAIIAPGTINASDLGSMGATTGQMMMWNGSFWLPVNPPGADNWGTQSVVSGTELSGNGTTASPLKLAAQGAANGQVLKYNGTAWVPAADASGNDNWGTQSVQTSTALSGNGTTASPLTLATQGATNGQVLKYNGTAWVPAADASGNDNWGTQSVQTSTVLSGNGTTASPLTLATQGATNGQVLKFNGSSWAPATDASGDNWGSQAVAIGTELSGNGTTATPLKLATQGATNGQVLKFNGTSWAPAADASGDNWGSQAVSIGTELSGNGTTATPLKLATQGATNGQVLKFNGTSWTPAADASGDNWGSQAVAIGTELSGNGTTATPLKLATQGATNGQVLTFDGSSWKPATPSGSGIGDNWGTQAAMVGATLVGDGTALSPLNIAPQGALSGQVLKFNGTTWVPGTDAAGGDNWGSQAAAVGNAISGNGTSGNPINIAQQGATSGQVLAWDGSMWKPATIPSGGAGDNWGTQTVVSSSVLTGSGTVASPLTLAGQGANFGQTLKWDGSKWSPADDIQGTGGGTGNTYNSGSGISISGTAPNFTINNIGDLSSTNEIQALSLAGNTLSLSNGGGSVTLPAATSYTEGTGINISGTAPNLVIENTGDLSATNEIQTIALTGNVLSLSNGGGFVTVDASPTNEIQTIGLTGNTLSLSNGGGSVTIDASTTNEIQALSIVGNTISLSNGGGSVTVPTGSTYLPGAGISFTGTAPNQTIVNTGDLSTTNELQTLSLNGAALKISGTNTTVLLDTLLGSASSGFWKILNNNIYNANSGNVGVGLTIPKNKLHIKGSGDLVRLQGINAGLVFSTSDTLSSSYIIKKSNDFIIGTNDSSSIMLNTNSPGIRIEGLTGNTTIGSNTPSAEKLKVVHGSRGFALQNGAAGPNWEFFVSDVSGALALYNNQAGPGVPVGVFATNGTYTSSDRRLKKDILPIPSVLSKLNQLQPVTYRFNYQNQNAPISMGFIAQDVQTLFPELVMENPVRDGKDSTLLVNYNGLGVVAIRAIQEQQAQIDRLNSENAQLRARLDAIEMKLKDK